MTLGKIITIEGPDGTGKGTQKNRLVERMQTENIPVYSATFPDYDSEWGKMITYHKQGGFKNLKTTVQDICWLFALDRKEKQEQFQELLEQGTHIILERYLESNLAYQGSKLKGKKRKEVIDWIWDLETKVLGIRPSDYVIFLDLPIRYSIKAAAKRNLEAGITRDIYDENPKLQREAYKTYKQLAKQTNWITVPCVKANLLDRTRYSEDEMAEAIWNTVMPLLQK